ncbi:MAG: hypothetical protein V1907_02545 [Candidatus Kerfeldbacteria bacterium]
MTIPHTFSTTKTALVIAIIIVLFAFFLPRSFGAFPIESCSTEAADLGWCRNQNIWMGYLLMVFFWISLVIMPILFGVLLGYLHTATKASFNRRLTQVLLCSLIIAGLPALVEILFLPPWKNVVGPTGVEYSPYALSAVFSTAAASIPFLLVISGYCVMAFVKAAGSCLQISRKQPTIKNQM